MTARRYLVTGGTGALGRSVVLRLLEDGASVAVPHRGGGSFEALKEAASGNPRLSGGVADFESPASLAAFVDDFARGGPVDGVAALAGGYAGSATLEVAPEAQWKEMLTANLETLHATCRVALPHLLRSKGSVVTVSAAIAEAGGAGAAAYAVAKGAVRTLTRVLALENRERGVRFNCIAPTIIDTPANRRAIPGADTSRWTPPSSIARVVAFLLSPDSEPTTGAWIPV